MSDPEYGPYKVGMKAIKARSDAYVEGWKDVRYSPPGSATDYDVGPTDEALIAYTRLLRHAPEDIPALVREVERLREAIHHAMYALHPNQGERSDPILANQWLSTTLPVDHPNYVNRSTLT